MQHKGMGVLIDLRMSSGPWQRVHYPYVFLRHDLWSLLIFVLRLPLDSKVLIK